MLVLSPQLNSNQIDCMLLTQNQLYEFHDLEQRQSSVNTSEQKSKLI